MTIFRAALAAFCCLVLSACDTSGDTRRPVVKAVPTVASYQCGEAGTITVVNSGTSVKVTTDDGTEVVLPASPPESRSRYGEPAYALVLDGSGALWMKSGKRPAECRRQENSGAN